MEIRTINILRANPQTNSLLAWHYNGKKIIEYDEKGKKTREYKINSNKIYPSFTEIKNTMKSIIRGE